jgi:3-phenylpropionate/trans-cinnamate dioxygenase ferredoxin subunit
MNDFVKVARVGEVGPGSRKVIDFDTVTVVLFNVNGQHYCIEDVCTHDGGPLADGDLNDHAIACPRHGAEFDVRDGRALTMPAVTPAPTYEVKIKGQDVYIANPDAW